MAKSVVGGDNLELAPGSSGTMTYPTVAAGDIAYIIGAWYWEGSSLSTVTPAESGSVRPFTAAVAETSVDGGDGGTGTSNARIWYRELTGDESGNDVFVSVTGSTAHYANYVLVVFRGTGALTHVSINTANVIDNGTDATASSVSAADGQLLVGLYAISDPPGTTNAAPSGMSVGQDGVNTGANSCRIYYQDITSTGATGDKTWDFTNTRDSASWLMLANDAGEGGGGSIVPQAMAAYRMRQA